MARTGAEKLASGGHSINYARNARSIFSFSHGQRLYTSNRRTLLNVRSVLLESDIET